MAVVRASLKSKGSAEGALSARQIERVLASGALEGFTPGVAKKLVARFGARAMAAIKEWDMEAKSILGSHWDKASDEAHEHDEAMGMLSWLCERGFSGTMARNTMLWLDHESQWTHPDLALAAWKGDPYLLAEIPRVSFERADRIALELGIDPDGDQRSLACAQEALSISCDNAGGGARLADAQAQARKLLGLNGACAPKRAMEIAAACFDKAQAAGLAVVAKDEKGQPMLFTAELYEAEEKAAHLMLALLESPNPLSSEGLSERIADMEEATGLTLHDEQRDALATMFKGRISLVCGKPGSGKTTLLKCAAPLLEAGGKKVLYAAPTGKAAKRMSQSLGRPASTLHRLLSVKPGKGKGKGKGKDSQSSDSMGEKLAQDTLRTADAVVLDETSMLDSKMFLRLLSSLGPKTALILVGDPQQLPSVGAGKVLRDLIDSKRLPTAIMTKVMRQSASSNISSVARAIGDGQWIDFKDKAADCVMLEAPDAYDIAPRIAKMLLGGAAAKYHPLKDSQVLAAGNMGTAGVHALNERLQALLNPPEAGKAEALVKEGLLLRVGDKVMQTSNDYERSLEPAPRLPGAELTVDEMLAQANKKGVFNGDVGYIESIDVVPAPGKIRVKFDEGTAEYSLKEASTSLALSYVCTVHKFQGSEAPLIFFVMHESTSIMLRTRNLVYTAITRAKSKCLVMGSENVLRAAVKRDALEGRKTRLCGLIDGSIAVDATATPSVLALSEKQGFAKLVDDHAADLKAGQAELEFGASSPDGTALTPPVAAPKKRRAKAL